MATRFDAVGAASYALAVKILLPRGTKAYGLAALGLVLLLGTWLRASGLTWGLEGGYGMNRNYHPDEFISMRGVLQIDLLSGKLTASGAYFEGTFNYYIWAVPAALMNLSHNPAAPRSADQLRQLLLTCRVLTVIVDVTCIALVFLAGYEATTRFLPSLLGAACYAVIPIQVIYSHFMRTHVLSNFFCAVVLWLSIKLQTKPTWWLMFLTGFLSGLGAATRYPVAVIACIPFFFLLFAPLPDSPRLFRRLLANIRKLLTGPAWIIALGFVIGLFVGEPPLFLRFHEVVAAVQGQTLKYAVLDQFSAGNLLNVFLLWQYISNLIPHGMYPVLWVTGYAAIVYVLFRPSLYHLTLPILAFSVCYFYPMAKGYYVPSYARAGMLLFPGLCILIALTCHDLGLRARNSRPFAAAIAAAVCLSILPSLLFDIAYDRAMRRTDVRTALRDDLRRSIGDSPATVAVGKLGGYFFTTLPAVEPLKSAMVTVRLQQPDEPADYFVTGWRGALEPDYLRAAMRSIERRGMFRRVRFYAQQPRLFDQRISLVGFPVDMTFPFPTLILFARNPPST